MVVELGVPIRLRPRLDPKPWGGRRLESFGLALPDGELIGEAVATAAESVATDGPLAGTTLGELVRADPSAILGRRGLAATRGRPVFPLLVKLIDARENLSIQVHPDDDAAAPLDRLGKTEAYHVLAADPGSVIGLGLDAGVTLASFLAACRAGSSEAAAMVRWLPAVPGTTFLIPAGTVHALGAGCLVYEVQRPSDVTYRFDDGGRLDAAGRPRELHVDLGAAVLNPSYRPIAIAPIRLSSAAGRRDLLAACDAFALERIELGAGGLLPVIADESPQAFTCVQGTVDVVAGDRAARIAVGWSAVTGASVVTTLAAVEPAVVLRAWVPDLAADVVAPARAAGARPPRIAALAGPLPDMARALST